MNKYRPPSTKVTLKAGHHGMALPPQVRRSIRIKFALLHLVSFILLTLVPIYIMATGLPAALCNMLGPSWSALFTSSSTTSTPTSGAGGSINTPDRSSKRLNLFAMYIYFCFTVTLLHLTSFVQLSALLKNFLALAFALVFALISFFGTCPNFNIINQVNFKLFFSNPNKLDIGLLYFDCF